MFSKKCEKKSHPLIAIMIGTLAVVGAFTVKRCSMDFIKQKWEKITSAFKNMPMYSCSSENSGPQQ